MNWTSNYTVGQAIDYFLAPAVGWQRSKVSEVGREFIRINPDNTSFVIAVTDPDRVKPA